MARKPKPARKAYTVEPTEDASFVIWPENQIEQAYLATFAERLADIRLGVAQGHNIDLSEDPIHPDEDEDDEYEYKPEHSRLPGPTTKAAGLLEAPPKMVREIGDWVEGQVCAWLVDSRGEAPADVRALAQKRADTFDPKNVFSIDLEGWKYLRDIDRIRERATKALEKDLAWWESQADNPKNPYGAGKMPEPHFFLGLVDRPLGPRRGVETSQVREWLRRVESMPAADVAEAYLRQVAPRWSIDVVVDFRWPQRGGAEWFTRNYKLVIYAGSQWKDTTPARYNDVRKWNEHSEAERARFFHDFLWETRQSVEHELIHMTQDLLKVLHGLKQMAGKPGRSIRRPDYPSEETLRSSWFHPLRDIEFYTRLKDEVRTFWRAVKEANVPADRWDQARKAWVGQGKLPGYTFRRRPWGVHSVSYGPGFFGMLKSHHPLKWRKAVAEFMKATEQDSASRVARRFIAKATGIRAGDGSSVGLFMRLPKHLAEKFPGLGENDTSPSHVTFLYIGEFKDKDEQARLIETLRESLKRWWPKCKAKLDGLQYFDHPDKNRRVPHVSVSFDKDLSGFKQRVMQELRDEGFEVGDRFPEFKPHVTLAYMPGMDGEWDKEVPEGEWDVTEMEVWGLPRVHTLPLGKVSHLRVASHWRDGSAHAKSIALMRFLSREAQRLGVARHTYVVGGAIRNFLIERPIKDIDVVIDSVAAGKDSEWFAEQIGRAIPAATNLTTNQYGVAILTVKGDWELEGQNLKGEVIEIANARKESYGGETGKGYKPHMVEPTTIHEDVYRREFTFNTLMWRLLDLTHGPEKAEVIDLTGCGKRDLEKGVLQCPREPDIVFSDDPTRILRAIKFTGKYGFKIPRDLATSIQRNAPKMKQMPYEALMSILVDAILPEPTARKSLKQMKDLGILDVLHDMVQEQKPFASALAKVLGRERRVQLLLDWLDLGLPAKTPLHFLGAHERIRVREITVSMDSDDATKWMQRLIKPPVNNKEVIDSLALVGRDRAKIQPLARRLILVNPDLAHEGRRLTNLVIERWV